jgi:predicted kinase
MKIYNRYAVMYGFGLGATENSPDIKSRFAIIDGEINAGNNNPQLIRDARKLLKEMVMQKLVTLYEAQTHLKHLRKLNKI